MKRIVSAVPGRFRIKDSAFGEAAVSDKIVERLKQEVSVLSTRVNNGANSIVVHYDEGRMLATDMHQRTEQLLAELLGKSPTHRRRRSKRLRINRYAKIGALTSLAASMAFAASGHKRLHGVTGSVFLACLGVHLAVFRRTLVH